METLPIETLPIPSNETFPVGLKVKKPVGRKPMSPEQKAIKNEENKQKRRLYAKKYYDSRFKYVRQIMALVETYNIPNEILTLPHDTNDDAIEKIKKCKQHIKMIKSMVKKSKLPTH